MLQIHPNQSGLCALTVENASYFLPFKEYCVLAIAWYNIPLAALAWAPICKPPLSCSATHKHAAGGIMLLHSRLSRSNKTSHDKYKCKNFRLWSCFLSATRPVRITDYIDIDSSIWAQMFDVLPDLAELLEVSVLKHVILPHMPSSCQASPR